MNEYELELDINNTCRVCLQSPDRLINIFSNVITDGKIVAFPIMLTSCLNLEVNFYYLMLFLLFKIFNCF